MMAINLSKGSSINLVKEAGPAPLDRIVIGLGWDPADTGSTFDLDASAFLTDAWGRCADASDFVFYNQPMHPNGSVQHMGDNRSGEGEGDDEQIIITLSAVPASTERVRIVVSIDEAASRGLHFGLVQNAFVRVENQATGIEMARYSLSQGGAGQDALIFAELYRDGEQWHFRALGEFIGGGLGGVVAAHGL